jgi:hypothetical protein
MYASHQIQWFHDYAEAEAIEREEIAKFLAYDRERERLRLEKLGITEANWSYSIVIVGQQPGRKTRH